MGSLNLISRPENTPADGRSRVEKTLCEALLWQRLGRPQTAAAAAFRLEELLKKHSLPDYDPELSARALGAMYTIYRSLGAPFQAKARECLNRLSELKPGEVLKLPQPEDE